MSQLHTYKYHLKTSNNKKSSNKISAPLKTRKIMELIQIDLNIKI